MPPKINPTPRHERLEALMVDEIRRGASVSATARRYRISKKKVQAACKEYGMAAGRDGGERVYWIIAALLGSDRRLTEIAEEQGVSKVYVDRIYQRCRTAGIPVRERPRGRPKTQQREVKDPQHDQAV